MYHGVFMQTGAEVKKSESIVLDFKKIVDLKGKKQEEAIIELFARFSNDEAKFTAIKQCLKAWDIRFEGDDKIPAIELRNYDQMPPEIFGKYFNDKLYAKAYALSHLAYQFEKNGIAA